MTMGIGYNLPRHLIVKRRFRWTFEVTANSGASGNISDGNSALTGVEIVPVWCKIAMRPNITFEELELNFLSERAYLSGKPQWEPITITLLDCSYGGDGGTSGGKDAAAENLRRWAQAVYNYGSPEKSGAMSDGGKYYKTDAMLKMFDGPGNLLESWTLYGAWPQQINWGDLDYTNNDSADIEVTLRFDNAEQFLSKVGGGAGQFGSNSDNGPSSETINT